MRHFVQIEIDDHEEIFINLGLEISNISKITYLLTELQNTELK